MAVEPNVLILANPSSGRLANRARVEALIDSLHRRGLTSPTIWEPDQSPLRDPCRCVIAAGGDGTVAAAVNMLKTRSSDAAQQPPLAILPLGNQNLLARELGFVVQPDRLADAIAARRVRRIDLGHTPDRWFAVMLSAGFDADVAHRLDRWRSADQQMRRVGNASYVKPILATAARYRFGLVELEADGTTCCSGAMALVFNVARYGLGLPFVRDAGCDDGLLHWVVFEKPGRLAALKYLAALLRGRHLQRRDVHHGTARHIRLLSEQPVPIQIDGEAAGFTPAEIEIEPDALAVLDMAG